jgi:aspartate aminotransferase-like enzyme
MDRWPGARVVFLTWSESSTGVLVELPEIGRAVRDAGRWLVADAVSGLAVSPLRMDDWEIDVVVAGSQKGLMLPPGLGLVAVGERAWEKSAGAGSPRFSLDWASHRDGVPSTPALSLMQQLDAALDLMDAMGPGGVFMRREVVANRIRALVRGAGLELYAKRPGNGVTSLVAPPGMDAGRFREILEEDYSILIEGGLGRLEGRILRIGHPGHVTDEELDYFSRSFISALRKLMPSWQAAEKPDGR